MIVVLQNSLHELKFLSSFFNSLTISRKNLVSIFAYNDFNTFMVLSNIFVLQDRVFSTVCAD